MNLCVHMCVHMYNLFPEAQTLLLWKLLGLRGAQGMIVLVH